MIVCTSVRSLQNLLNQHSRPVHFVPTMGALHDGHIELVRRATEKKGIVVCSIFVNPTQFNESADLEKYPRTTAADIYLLQQARCQILFLPDVEEIYPSDLEPLPFIDTKGIESRWEGHYRPGHFDGMLQVVHRLLSIVKPDFLYMGQKDYQQQLLVSCMMQSILPDITLVTVPTKRESSGLAMSSRNTRLHAEARSKAAALYKVLTAICEGIRAGHPAEQLIQEKIQHLENQHFKIDYLAVVNPTDMQACTPEKSSGAFLVIAAVWLDDVRLIDNILCQETNLM
jgi:pantoate--beta-alanine ligase